MEKIISKFSPTIVPLLEEYVEVAKENGYIPTVELLVEQILKNDA